MSNPTHLTIYLLHYDVKLGRTHHYLGITRSSRLQQRLREHARGSGSVLTHQLAKINQRLYVARLWHNATPSGERRMKDSANLKRNCPICATGQLDIEMKCIEIQADPPSKPPLLCVDFSPRPRHDEVSSPHEKGGRRS